MRQKFCAAWRRFLCRTGDWRIAIFLLLAALLLLNANLTRITPIDGDGMEYFLMSQALMARGEPSLQKADMIAYDQALQRTGPGNRVMSLDVVLFFQAIGKEWNGRYFRASNGKMYSYHYWLYSLANAPALAASRLFGFAPTRSFLITNSLLILFAAFVVLFKARIPVWARITVLLMFLFSGTTFYLNWSGPEVFTACFALIGCAMFLSERPLFAALAFAAAAQQNPPVGFLAAAALAVWAWRSIAALRNRQISIRKLAPEFIGVAAILGFTMQSPLFYWINFGVPNLIVAKTATPDGYISLTRLISFYFDFDQGLIRGAPFLFGGLLAAFLLALSQRTSGKRALFLGLAFTAASIVVAIPSLSTPIWVSGCRVYLRYAYWGSVPLWFATVCFLDQVAPRRRNLLLALMLSCQAAWIAGVYRIDGASVEWRAHSWLSKKIIEHFPEHYNPDRHIFNVRTSAGSGLLFPPFHEYVFYLEHPGRISKLLYHTDSRADWIPECAATPADLEKAPGVERIGEAGGWAYLNLGNACPIPNDGGPLAFWVVFRERLKPLPPEGVTFKFGGNWDDYTWNYKAGWNEQMDGSVWLDGDAANISLLLASPPQDALALTLSGVGVTPPGQSPPAVAIYVNGVNIGAARFADGKQTSVALTIPPTLVSRSNGIFHVRLRMENGVSVQAPGRETGTPKPAIGIIGMNVEAVRPGP
jgi:hypothetical protein